MTPYDRACLEWAIRVVYAQDPDIELYVTRNGQLLWNGDVCPIDLSSDFVAVTLAQMLKLHLSGIETSHQRRDLLRSSVRKEAVDVLCDHIDGISAEELARLRERVDWYADDNASLITTQPENEVSYGG